MRTKGNRDIRKGRGFSSGAEHVNSAEASLKVIEFCI